MSNGAHKGSDSNAFNGSMNLYHILPMTKKAEKRLCQETDINSRINGEYNENLVKRRIRAKKLETKVNMERQAEAMPDHWHVLVDSAGVSQNKFKGMSFAEARRRNESIRGLGYQWTRGNP